MVLFWIVLSLVFLSTVKAYLCTALFKRNDRRKGNDKHTILGRIQAKAESTEKTGAQRSGPVALLKSYLFSYVTLYTYVVAWLPSQWARRFLYRHVLGCRIGRNSCLHIGVRMLMPHRVLIGNNCIVGEACFFDGRLFLEIGNNVNFSTGVTVWTMQHDPYSPTFAITGGAVTVQDNAWLSFRVTVLPRVIVGTNCVVGAHSLVTKSTEPDGIYFGAPARQVRKRNTEICYKLSPMGFFY